MRMLIYELSNDIMQREIKQEFTEMKVSKNKKSFFPNILLTKISQLLLHLALQNLRCALMRSIWREACLKILIGPSFYLRKCRN